MYTNIWVLLLIFSEKGQVIFTMYDYIKDIIGTAHSDMNGTALDPARAEFFTVDKSSTLLNMDAAEFFHSMHVDCCLLQSK